MRVNLRIQSKKVNIRTGPMRVKPQWSWDYTGLTAGEITNFTE